MKHSKKRGASALLGLGVMVILLTVVASATTMTINSMRRTSRDRNYWMAHQAAHAALEDEVTVARLNLPATNGDFVAGTRNVSTLVTGMAPGSTAVTTIAPQANAKFAWITSTVTYNKAVRSVRALIAAKDVSIWNNAVFAGSGAAGHAINGNVDIRGSMHILGEGERYADLNGNTKWDPAEPYTDKNKNGVWDPGELFTDTNGDGVWTNAEPYNDTNKNGFYDPPLTQTDMSTAFGGTAYVGNNYSGMPAALEALLPPAPQVNSQESLSGEVRVKHGRIAISGSATIGTTSVVDGGTSKATIDGTYVSDGYTGTKGASAVFSDNGTTNAYDLDGVGISFPLIAGLGAEQYQHNTQQWTDMAAFYDAYALSIPVTTITSTTAAFSYGPDANGNSIIFTPATSTTPAVLAVEGVVKVSTLQLGSKDVIRYQGRGTIYSSTNINVDGDFLPKANLKFPLDTTFGLVAKGDLNLATGNGSSQLSMAGAFYAQGTIRSAKQNQIAGTFVANYFDMGTNVPNLYQVPALTYNMPPHMPGDKHFYSVKIRTWREREVAQIK